jgi:hypothetical protein
MLKYNIRFAALEDLDTAVEINNTWQRIREKIKTSAKYESKLL